MIETITYNKTIIAIIIYKDYQTEGIAFITPKEFSLQLGYMNRPAGYQIMPHTHNPIRRETVGTQEVLFIKSGAIRIDFYTLDHHYVQSRDLSAGDIIMLAGAGHGITVLEPVVMVEVKNGPYCPEADKARFECKKDASNASSKSTTSQWS